MHLFVKGLKEVCHSWVGRCSFVNEMHCLQHISPLGFKPRIALALHRMDRFHLAQRKETTAGCRYQAGLLKGWHERSVQVLHSPCPLYEYSGGGICELPLQQPW